MTHTLRINFDDKEWENIEFLMNNLNIGSPQKFIRGLIDRENIRARNLPHNNTKRRVPRETSEPRLPTVEEITTRLFALDDTTLIFRLEDIGFLSKVMGTKHVFKNGDPTIDEARGKTYLHMLIHHGTESSEESDLYEKGDELRAAVLAFLKENPNTISKLVELGV